MMYTVMTCQNPKHAAHVRNGLNKTFKHLLFAIRPDGKGGATVSENENVVSWSDQTVINAYAEGFLAAVQEFDTIPAWLSAT